MYKVLYLFLSSLQVRFLFSLGFIDYSLFVPHLLNVILQCEKLKYFLCQLLIKIGHSLRRLKVQWVHTNV